MVAIHLILFENVIQATGKLVCGENIIISTNDNERLHHTTIKVLCHTNLYVLSAI